MIARFLFPILFLVATTLPALADTVILLTRHGDRDDLAENLNAAGRARAEALVAAVAEFDIAAIFTVSKARNLDTAAPLAANRSLPVVTLAPYDEARTLRAASPGRAVIWIGNTDNLERLFEDLGGEGTPPEFYGDLWVLTLNADGKTTTERRHYGQ